jgi:hypothetical protein
MPATMVPLGGVDMNLLNLCPIPLAWAPYFMDFKTPHEALQMGSVLLGTLTTVANQNWATPLIDWLRAACVRKGAAAETRNLGVLDQDFEPTGNHMDAGKVGPIFEDRRDCPDSGSSRSTSAINSREYRYPIRRRRVHPAGDDEDPSSLWPHRCPMGYRPPRVVYLNVGGR